ncbi:MAG TPA: hypothetical protein VGE62_01445 [Candidatus Paceibacterota bacterium]
MIIGFLGKGGSGKSTASHRFTRFLHDQGNKVMALDLDHNMDMMFNFGISGESHPDFQYLGLNARPDIYEQSAILPGDFYDDLFTKDSYSIPTFKPFGNTDPFSEKYSQEIKPNLKLMAMGPHPEQLVQGGGCSHQLATSMKVYLPLVELEENEFVVVDEKASSDSVGTGIPSGFDMAYICVENTPHSIKTAKLIAGLLDELSTPYGFIATKVKSAADTDSIEKGVGRSVTTSLSFDPAYANPELVANEENDAFSKITSELEALRSQIFEGNAQTRKERTIAKFTKNKKYREER